MTPKFMLDTNMCLYLMKHQPQEVAARFATPLGSTPKSLFDNLAYAEKMGWIDSAEVLRMDHSA